MSEDWRVADPRVQFAVDQALKSIDAQREHLGELKNRTVAMLSVAAIAIGLAQESVFVGGRPTGWGWVALLAMALLFGLALHNAWPRDWGFARRPAEMPWYWTDGQATFDQFLLAIFHDVSTAYEENRDRLRPLETAHAAAVVALGATLIAVTGSVVMG